MREHARQNRFYFKAGVVLLLFLGMAWIAFASDSYATERDVEWGQYQNSPTNNGVIGEIETPATYNETALKWINRLSDYLFVFARWSGAQKGEIEAVWSK